MIRIIGRSLSVFSAIVVGAVIAFACFAPEDAVIRARSYIPIAVKMPTPVACEEKAPAPLPTGKIEFGSAFDVAPDTKVLRITLTGIIREVHERQMVEVLDRAERDGVTDVELLIDSLGGAIETGFHLAALLAEAPVTVHCLAGRYTSSSAFVVFQGCDDRATLPTSSMMEHRPYLNVITPMQIQAEALREAADELILARRLMVSILAVRSAQTLGPTKALSMEEIERRLAGDWAMTPTEAVSFGFVDRIVPSIEVFQQSIEDSAPVSR